MNERLLDICIKAGINTWPFNEVGFISLDESELVKFAELIVRECMACSTWVGKVNKNAKEPIHTAHAINQRIKKHFGVEE